MYYVNMYEQLGVDHKIDFDELVSALEEFEAVALKFSQDFILDARQRKNYNDNVKRLKSEVLGQLNSGKISIRKAAFFCHEMRNRVMAETRIKTSPQGVLVAEFLKKAPRTMADLMSRYSKELYGREFKALNERQQWKVYYAIIEASARPDVTMNTLNRRLATVGKVFIVFTIAYSVYGVMTADDKSKAAVKEASSIALGLLGASAGANAGAVCGPFMPWCSTIFSIVGGVAGSVAGGYMGDFINNLFYEGEEAEIYRYMTSDNLLYEGRS